MADRNVQGAGIKIKNLYKIFGQRPDAYVEAVKKGMSKTELNEKHGHVLGLRDINIDMPAGCIQVIMGLSGSGKSTLIRHINRLIDPTAGEVIIDNADVVQDEPERSAPVPPAQDSDGFPEVRPASPSHGA